MISDNDKTQAMKQLNGPATKDDRERKKLVALLIMIFLLLVLAGGFFSLLYMAATDAAREDRITERAGRDCIQNGGVWHEGSCFYSRKAD